MRFLSEEILCKMDDTPEFVRMLKHVLKYEVQILLQRLAEAGEESLVITVNLDDKSHGCLGSEMGRGYSQDLHTVQDNFLHYCIDKCKDKRVMFAAKKGKKHSSELSSVVDLTNFSLELFDSDTQTESKVTGSSSDLQMSDHISVNIEPDAMHGKRSTLFEEQKDGFPSEKDPDQSHSVENDMEIDIPTMVRNEDAKEIEVPTVVKNEDGEIFFIESINDEIKESESLMSITQISDKRDSINSDHSEIEKYNGSSDENSPCHGSESLGDKRRISVEFDDLQPFHQPSNDPTCPIQQSQTGNQSQTDTQTIFPQRKSGTQTLSYQDQTGTEKDSPQSEGSTGKQSPKSSNGSALNSCEVTDMSEMSRFYSKDKKSRQFGAVVPGSVHSGSEYHPESTSPWQRFSDTKSDDYQKSDQKNASRGATISKSNNEDNHIFGTSSKISSSSNQSVSSVRFENQSMLTNNDQRSTQSLNRHSSIDRQQENQVSRLDFDSCHGNMKVMAARKRSCEFSQGHKPQEITQFSHMTSSQIEKEKIQSHLQPMSIVKRDKETDSDVFVVDLTYSNKSEERSSCDQVHSGNPSEQQMTMLRELHKQRMSSDTVLHQRRCQPQYRVASAEKCAPPMQNAIEGFGQSLVSPAGIYQRSPNEHMQSNILNSSPKNSVQFSLGSHGHQKLSGTMATSQMGQTAAQRNPMFSSPLHMNRSSPQGMTTSKNLICDAMAAATSQGQGQFSAQRGQLEGIPGANIQHLGLNADAQILSISGIKTNRAKFDESTFVLIGNMAKCLLCNKILKNKMSRRYHWRYHMGEKPYKCKYCEQRFGHPSNLVTHTRTHTRPFQCIYCSAKFARRTELEKHNSDRHSNM